MTRLIQFHNEKGFEILVEAATDECPSGEVRVSESGNMTEKAAISLEESIGRIRPLTDTLLAQLTSLAKRPDEIALEFGIKFSSEAGIVVAKAAVEGQITIKIVWNRDTGV
ncbi:hypothetical protein PS850_06114 [Pseudomonas fluorescens]|nr:hypothetical protein PS850_06114 [Pseudomonas fluorescens]